MNKKGFINTPFVLVVVVGIGLTGYLLMMKEQSPVQPMLSPTPELVPSSTSAATLKESIFGSRRECEQKSGRPCSFQMCYDILERKKLEFEEVCWVSTSTINREVTELKGAKVYAQEKYGYSFTYPNSVYIQENDNLNSYSSGESSLQFSDGMIIRQKRIRCGSQMPKEFQWPQIEKLMQSGYLVDFYAGGGYENYEGMGGGPELSAKAVVCNKQNTFCLHVFSRGGHYSNSPGDI